MSNSKNRNAVEKNFFESLPYRIIFEKPFLESVIEKNVFSGWAKKSGCEARNEADGLFSAA
jgi:hypothetical protein